MKTHISIQEKKNFIMYFLNNYQLKRRESIWIFNYLATHDKVLENVHFVEDAKFCDRSLFMSTHCVDAIPFRFFKGDHMSTDGEKAFNDIKLNRDERLFVELQFKNRYKDDLYVSVLEDNPFTNNNVNDPEIIREAKEFLDHSIDNFKEKQMLKQIDDALDNRDERLFVKLTNRFKEEFGCQLSM